MTVKCPFEHNPINIACKFCVWCFERDRTKTQAEERKAHNERVIRLYGLRKRKD